MYFTAKTNRNTIAMNQEEKTEGEAKLNFDVLTLDKVSPLFHNSGLIKPPYNLYRLNSPTARTYFRFEDEANFKNPLLYMGTSSITSQMPISRELQKYKATKGWIESEREMAMWSLYGSFSDSRIAELISKGRFELGLEGLPLQLKEYFYWQRFFLEPFEFNHMAKCIKQDMIGFERFIYDRKVQFFFVEYPVVSEIDGLATPIDFGCFFNVDKKVDAFKINGEKKKIQENVEDRIVGLFNYKSGKIYPNYAIQCMAERLMFQESYPEFSHLPIRSFNITIREWKTANWDKYRPTSNMGKPYQIKDWTDEANEDDYRDYLSLAKRKREKQINRKITTIEGDMRIGDEPSKYITTKTIKEIIEDGSWQKYSKSNESIPSEFVEPISPVVKA